VSLVEQELITLLEHPSSPPIISGVRVIRSLVLCIMYCGSLFVLFLLAIVLFVLLLFTDSDYPFGIFKLFLPHINTIYTFWNLKMHLYYVYYDKCYWIMHFFMVVYMSLTCNSSINTTISIKEDCQYTFVSHCTK
jgi:hypothetical protein